MEKDTILACFYNQNQGATKTNLMTTVAILLVVPWCEDYHRAASDQYRDTRNHSLLHNNCAVMVQLD